MLSANLAENGNESVLGFFIQKFNTLYFTGTKNFWNPGAADQGIIDPFVDIHSLLIRIFAGRQYT